MSNHFIVFATLFKYIFTQNVNTFTQYYMKKKSLTFNLIF